MSVTIFAHCFDISSILLLVWEGPTGCHRSVIVVMQASAEFGHLDKKAQKEVASFVEQQQQMQQIQAIVGKITEICWDKCVSKPGKDLSDTEKTVSPVSTIFFEFINLTLFLFSVPFELFRTIFRHQHVRGKQNSIQTF
jgi:hypothetical protein